MAKFKDLRGQKFGRLTVLERVANSQRTENHRPRTRWLCVCDCGKQTVVRSENLVAGTTLSCGCLQKEAASAANKRETPFIVKDDIAIGKTAQGIEFIPCDPEQILYRKQVGGGIKIVTQNGEVLSAELESNPNEATGIGYVSHFATCPEAGRFRKR